MKNEIWKKLFGFDVGHEMKKMVLSEVRKTGEPLEQVIAKYTLPEIAILDEDGKFDFAGKRITPDEWRQINPLREHGRIVIIH